MSFTNAKMVASDSKSAHLHLPSLDGLRTFCVLLVAAAHSGFGDFVPGGLGVTIFFFLSGFLITNLLDKEFAKDNAISLSKFFGRRFFRLAPAFLVTLAVADLLTYLKVLDGEVTILGSVAQIFYLANYLREFSTELNLIPAGTEVFWSLAVEEHFYLIYPTVASLVIFKLRRRTRAIIFLAACIGILAWRYHLAAQGVQNTERIYYSSDTRFDSILWGCFFAVIYSHSIKNDMKFSHFKLTLMFLGGLSFLLFSLLVRDQLFKDSLKYSIQGLALVPIFFYLLNARSSYIYRLLNLKPIADLGKLTYAFYLNHFIVINLLCEITDLKRRPSLLFACATTLAFMAAWIVTTYVEAPARKWHEMRRRPRSVVTVCAAH